jgi:hypothetical protein
MVRKDFVRLWGPLVLWALLLAARDQIGVAALAGDGAGTDRFFYLNLGEATLRWVALVVNVLLVAALVQEDPVAVANGFWVTRPLSGARLLGAKLLGAALMFGALPAVVALRWWWVCGYGVAEMAQAAGALLAIQAKVTLGAFALAALTRNLNQFIAWGLGLVVARVLGGVGMASVIEAVHPPLSRGADETKTVALAVLGGGSAAAVLAIQYVTRRKERALAVAALAAAIMALVDVRGWDFSAMWTSAPRTSAHSGQVKLAFDHGDLTGTGGTINLLVRGLPEWAEVRVAADHVWQWPAGTTVVAWSRAESSPWNRGAEWRALGLTDGAAMRTYGEGKGLDGGAGGEAPVVPLRFFLWPEANQMIRQAPAVHAATVHVGLWQPERVADLPLRAGEEWRWAGQRVKIIAQAWKDEECRVSVVESSPVFGWNAEWQPILSLPPGSEREMPTSYALVNRARGEAVKLWPAQTKSLLVGSQRLTWTLMTHVVRREATDPEDGPPRWLEGATLAVLRYHETERFDREMKDELTP